MTTKLIEDRLERSLQDNCNNDFIELTASFTTTDIVTQFEQQVTCYPKNIAVRSQDAIWDYSTLKDRVDRIAQKILSHTKGEQGLRIALIMSVNEWAIAAILAILKAGQLYLPIDPLYPKTRIDYILADADVSLILTNKDYYILAEELTDRPIVRVDDAISPCDEIPYPSVASTDLAYIIYTSGSTGEPKGVMQTHQNLLQYIRNYSNKLKITPQDRLTLFYSLSFSASLMDIFSALLKGAALYLYPLKERGIADLGHWLTASGITVYHAVPTVFRHFVASLNQKEGIDLSKIRVIDLGGETVYPADIEKFRQYFSPSAVLINHLAATEISVIAQNVIDHQTVINTTTVAVGEVAADTEVSIIGEDGQMVAQGEVGELVISSRYLSPGYWRKAALTAQVIAEDTNGLRSYRSGDLGRINSNGQLEYLGRRDFRIKVRGNSIEVAEIENALLSFSAIKEVVVTAKADLQGEDQLVAYYVLKQRPGIANEQLRQRLKEQLPEYMIPSLFIELTALPLTVNGKIDLKTLPQPNWQRPIDTPFVAPTSAMEEELQRLWQEVLQLPKIGIKDDFFALGGTSIKALELLPKLEKRFKIKLPAVALLQLPTIELMAEHIAGHSKKIDQILVSIQPLGSNPPLFCLPGLNGDTIVYRKLSLYLGNEQPIYGLQMPWKSKWPDEYCQIADLSEAYIRLMRTIQPKGRYYLAGISFGGVVAMDIAQRLIAAGDEVATVILLDSYGPDYPKLLPAAIRAKQHQKAMKKLNLREKIDYLMKHSLDKMESYKTGLWLKIFLPFFHYRFMRKLFKMTSNITQGPILKQTFTLDNYCHRVDLLRAMERPTKYYPDPLLGWSKVLTDVRTYDIAGDHNMIMRENLEISSKQIANILRQLQE